MIRDSQIVPFARIAARQRAKAREARRSKHHADKRPNDELVLDMLELRSVGSSLWVASQLDKSPESVRTATDRVRNDDLPHAINDLMWPGLTTQQIEDAKRSGQRPPMTYADAKASVLATFYPWSKT